MNRLLPKILWDKPIHIDGRSLFSTFFLIFFPIFYISLFCQPLRAEPLLSVYNLAVNNDAEFKAALYGHKASLELPKQALTRFMPNVVATAEYGDTKLNSIKNPYDSSFYKSEGDINYDTRTFTLSLSQPVINFGNLENYREAKSQQKQADIELEISKQDLIVRVAGLYLAALAAQDAVQTVQAEKAAVEQLYELTEKKFNSGLAAITDLHDAKARNALVSSNLIEAENLRDDSFEALQEVCGVPIEEISPLGGNFNPIEPTPDDADSWVNKALEQNLRLTDFRYARESAQLEIRKQRSAHFPTMDLVTQYKKDEAGDTLIGGPSENETAEVFVRASLPLYQGGFVVSKTKEAIALYQQVNQNAERQRRAVIRETRSAFLGVKSSIGKIAALEQSLQSQKLAVSAKKEGYNAGIFTTLDVLDAQRDLYTVIRDLQQARYDFIANSLKLKLAEGTLAEEDIIKVDEWFEKTM